MNNHFEFVTDDTISIDGHILTRIRAIVDLLHHGVVAGDLGGYIEKYSNLCDTAWVGGDACVYDNACVCDNACVRDNACISENAMIGGNACVCDNAMIGCTACVYDNACVSENARIFGNAVNICGNAQVSGHAQLFDSPIICDDVHVSEYAVISGEVELFGNARIGGAVELHGRIRIGSDAMITSVHDFVTVGPAMSSGRYTTGYKTTDGIKVTTGCFTGTIAEFNAAIERTHHAKGQYWKQYMAFSRMIEEVLG